MTSPKRVALLGSTGSIGTQTLDVIKQNPTEWEVEVLAAFNQAELLIEQAIAFKPNVVVIVNEAHYARVKEALASYPIKIFTGEKSLRDVVQMDSVDVVVAAIVGFAGLSSAKSALEAGKVVALANKETLVVAGELIADLCIQNKTTIIPIDSEHSAILQCLMGESPQAIEKIILTASGGPFRGKTKAEKDFFTLENALKHPNWSMGSKITIDSASLMNKGLEVIEARWLFNVSPQQIEVVVHPQSIIHSFVQFTDGSVKAQLGLPDMRLPIQFALTYPKRLPSTFPRMNFQLLDSLTFSPPDTNTFRNLSLAYQALAQGGNMPCILNAANEIVVQAFQQKKIDFFQMSDYIEKSMHTISFIAKPTWNDIFETDKETRAQLTKQLGL